MEVLKGKIIVITGASSGFGKGVALKLAEKGANLILAARREDLLKALAQECKNIGVEAVAVPTDVSVLEQVENLTQIALSKFGRIDVWINDAGAAAVGAFTEVPLADHIQVIKTDLIGTLQGSYFALRQFQFQNSGTLINIASMIGKIPAPYYASYTAAKHGVVGLSASLRQELRANNINNIHVCTVMPMAMDTPFFEHASNYTGRETVPIPPLDDAQKVIDVIVNLISDPKDEVPIGLGGGSNLVLHNIAPGFSETLMGLITHKSQMENAPESTSTTGALKQPQTANSGGSGIKDPKLSKS